MQIVGGRRAGSIVLEMTEMVAMFRGTVLKVLTTNEKERKTSSSKQVFKRKPKNHTNVEERLSCIN